jgi:polyhydroxyalkanoate synthesis regulator phasin
MFLNKKVALAAGVGILTAVLLGGAALAAFAPVTENVPSALEGEMGTATPANSGTDKLKSILDGLVAKGLITIGQADAILAAVKAAEPVRDNGVKRIFASLLDESAKYLGLSVGDLKAKLPGTTLNAIAQATAGKTQAGLTATLQNAVNAAIDKALAEGKLTKEQADKAKVDAPAQIKRFVEQTHPQARAKTTRDLPKATTRSMKVGEFIGDIYSAGRTYLGLSQADLLAALRDGQTLGEIATSVGKNKADLVATITAAANTRIDKAATDGKLTAEQAAALRAQVGPAVTKLVDAKLPALKRR